MNLLEQLKAAGGIGTGEVIPRTVEWNGQKLELHFLDLPGGKVQELLKRQDADPDICVAALCCPDGSPALDLEDAYRLKLGLRALIVREAMDVFGFSTRARDAEKKSSAPIPSQSDGMTSP